MIKKLLIQLLLFLRSFLILIIFLLLGKGIQHLTGLPVPGSIFGLLLLFSVLTAKLLPLSYVLPAGNLLLTYITLLFVPVGVGLLKYTDLLQSHWLTIVASSLVSTIIVLLSVGWCFQRLSK